MLTAIAFGDAITVHRRNQHIVDDHGMLPDLVQRALGQDAAPPQIARLGRVLKEKNRVQSGGAYWPQQEAEDYLEQVRRFSGWAEQIPAERE